MKIPQEFRTVVHSLYLGSLEKCSTLQEWAAGAAGRNGDRRIRDVAEHFLEQVLARNPSAEELRSVWMGAGPTYFLGDEELGRFLPLLLAALKARRENEDRAERPFHDAPAMAREPSAPPPEGPISACVRPSSFETPLRGSSR